jgi:aspartyl-tRNA(Asn)/glutamyl-tRNA(Gln) amidotransferase subunit A
MIRTASLAIAVLLSAANATHAQEPPPASCEAIIRTVLADIATRDLDTSRGPPLNAFIAINPNALAQARTLDEATASGAARGALHCMPIAVKDNFDTYDLPSTAGSLSLIGNQPPRDAPFVARLRQAGAIVVGKTNMDEFAMGIRGLSGSGGRVGNAYDTNQSPGGSSAGSGAAVGAGLVPIAVGSDNCGSLRLPAVYNGAVSLRATYGRFDADGIFPIGFVNGVPGVIARDTATLRNALAVVDPSLAAAAADQALRGKRIGVLRGYGKDDPWAGADADTQGIFARAIDILRQAGAEIVEEVTLPDFDPRLGPQFIKGFARRVDAALSRYPSPRRDWRDVCASKRIRPEWSARDCLSAGATSLRQERRAVDQIARNRQAVIALLDSVRLDALVYPVDGRGGARAEESDHITCFIAGASGLPAAAFPVALDGRSMPVGLELLGRPNADAMLLSMMGAFEQARGPLPQAKPAPGNRGLAGLNIARQNELRLRLGWTAFRSRRGKGLGDLAPERFRALTETAVKAALQQR